jgi:uncharacterized phage protein gp47/JayE
MILSTPTTQGLAENLISQIDASLDHTTPFLPKGFTHVLSKALAGTQVLLHKYAGWMLLQMFVKHASAEETIVLGKKIRPLVELGRQIGVGDPLPATRAQLVITVTVQVQTGSLPAGSQLLFPATGVLYLTTASVLLNAATVQVTIRASSDQQGGGGEGAIGNLQPGAIVQFANPLPNVARNATVTAQSVTGADAEAVPDYRARVLRRVQAKPQGGAYADYRQWGEEEAGIIHLYPYTSATPGVVDIYAEATVESSGSADGIPTAPQLAAVLALINADEDGLATRRPANAAVNVLPISRVPFDVKVTGLQADDEPAAEDAIEQAVDEYLRSREPFIVGLSVLPRQDRITLAAVSGIVDDVVSALGGSLASVQLIYSGAPIPAYTLAMGQKSKLGTVTFI